uniref:Transposase n=1 Tax=Ascaris lumbricoides TaxID=6252 RepID=A0A0M3IJY9_ASCLU
MKFIGTPVRVIKYSVKRHTVQLLRKGQQLRQDLKERCDRLPYIRFVDDGDDEVSAETMKLNQRQQMNTLIAKCTFAGRNILKSIFTRHCST